MPTTDRPDMSPQDALSVARKLQALRDTLPVGEQAIVDIALRVFMTKVAEGRSVEELLAELPNKAELLDDVAGFRLEADTPSVLPTTTTTFTPYTPPRVSAICPAHRPQ